MNVGMRVGRVHYNDNVFTTEDLACAAYLDPVYLSLAKTVLCIIQIKLA